MYNRPATGWIDNPQVRVLEYQSRPGMGVCGTGLHSRPTHLTVLLTPARVRVTQNGHTMLVDQKAGDTFWSGPVTHEVENVSGAEVRALDYRTQDSRRPDMNAPTAIIAEDEPILRADLESKLAALWPDFRLVGSATNGVEALDLIDRHAPQIVFLDIQMPGLTGLEVARQSPGVAISCSSQLTTRTPCRPSSRAPSTIF